MLPGRTAGRERIAAVMIGEVITGGGYTHPADADYDPRSSPPRVARQILLQSGQHYPVLTTLRW